MQLTKQDIDKITRLVLAMLEKFEGLYLSPYLCPAGVWTIGLGTIRYPDGTPVRPTDRKITRAEAYAYAKVQLLEDYLPAVLKLCPTLENSLQVSAIADFIYNFGIAALRSSTLRKKILAKDFDAVPGELRKWVMGGGKKLNGLVRRREFEILVWRTLNVS
jgi:lysozyme